MKNHSLLTGILHSTAKEDLACYGYDASYARENPPALVCWPRSTEEVCRLMRYADAEGLAVVPRGAGTGHAGGSVPDGRHCLVLSLERMKKILEIDTRNMTAMVQPGVVNGWLQRELEYMGFFYPPDPSSLHTCTIGGNVATNAGGPRALKYGVTRQYVMEIEAVLPDGSVITAGGKTHKRTVGYDLKDLLIGSEGTLAVATKIRLKVLPLPEDVLTLLVTFRDIEAAGMAVSKIIISKVIPRSMELMDRSSIEAIERYAPTGLPADIDAALIIELDGYPATIKKEAERVVSVCNGLGGEAVIAEDIGSREKLWRARRALSPALYHLKPDKLNEDVVVPRGNMAALLTRLRKLSAESGIPIVCFGHAGDGNIHVNIMVDRKDPAEYEKGLSLIREVFVITLGLGGSISGEHGIGMLKKPYIAMEVGQKELELMRGIKAVFDGKGRLNPGKILPIR